MSTFSVGIIGTGPDPETVDHEGYSMGYRHASAYRETDGCRIIACADIVDDHARTFAGTFDLPPDRDFTDHVEMLDAVGPEIVSICTPPATHLDLVTDCAEHPAVNAVHCEKPLAPTFGESRELVAVCEREDVQLTVNLQNRTSPHAREVKQLIDDGAIGELRRVELARNDLLQTGIHHIDLANHVVGDLQPEWVLGQVHYPEEALWYTDMHAEEQGLGLWKYPGEIFGFASTGAGMDAVGTTTNRFLGTGGEIRGFGTYELKQDGDRSWTAIEAADESGQTAMMRDLVSALRAGRRPAATGEVGLRATEIVFGIWESARRRARVELPLTIDDNPLAALVEAGELPQGGE